MRNTSAVVLAEPDRLTTNNAKSRRKRPGVIENAIFVILLGFVVGAGVRHAHQANKAKCASAAQR